MDDRSEPPVTADETPAGKREQGGEGGYGGGSTGFDDPPQQGLGGETTEEADETGQVDETGQAGMTDKEIDEQPRGA